MNLRNAWLPFCLCLLLSVPSSTQAEETYYPVKVERVIDGDTFVGDLLLPWDVTLRNQRFRAATFDAHELKDKGGEAAKRALIFLSKEGYLWIKPVKKSRGNFGRILGQWFYDSDGKHPVATYMFEEGHTKP